MTAIDLVGENLYWKLAVRYLTSSVFDILCSPGAYTAVVTFPSLGLSRHWHSESDIKRASCEGFGVFALNYHFWCFKVQKPKE